MRIVQHARDMLDAIQSYLMMVSMPQHMAGTHSTLQEPQHISPNTLRGVKAISTALSYGMGSHDTMYPAEKIRFTICLRDDRQHYTDDQKNPVPIS